jgi:ABC-type sugar transport system permease subunit
MVSIAFVWSLTPFAAVLLLAALQTIPIELYRAAMVDGASAIKRFWYVTLPWLRPTLLIVLINATIYALFAFNLIYIMTGGGPGTSTTVFAWWGYVVSFRYFYLGQGTAILFFLTIASFLLTFVYLRLLSRPEEQQV